MSSIIAKPKRQIKWITGIIGLSIAAFGYSYSEYPINIVLLIAGLVLILVAFNFFIPRAKTRKSVGTNPETAEYITGSAVQGGSNFGQGSSHLAGNTYKQGDKKNSGSNYENENGKDIKPE